MKHKHHRRIFLGVTFVAVALGAWRPMMNFTESPGSICLAAENSASDLSKAIRAATPLPIEQSKIVVKNADGTLGVGQKDGTPIDGIKLSQHDSEILSPNIATAPNGTIHISFIEKHRTTYAYAVYHRMSTDGGATWSEAKNISEALVNLRSSYCKMLIDGKGRVYVIWRAGISELAQPTFDTYNPYYCNLVYRVFENGKWSKVVNIHPPGNGEKQDIGALQSFITVDPAGRAQVFYTVNPDVIHPELMVGTTSKQHILGISEGLLMQVTLDGTSTTPPREVYMTKITIDPNSPVYGKSCDGFGVINGYADAEGKPHFLAQITSYEKKSAHPIFKLVENGKEVPAIEMPAEGVETRRFPPTLLVDAKNRKHVISIFQAGEHPHVRDTLLGSDDEPTVIRATKGLKGTINGMQAFQAAGGQMVVILQMNDTGERGEGDNFVTTSTGEKWTPPINITNNAARRSFSSRQTSNRSNTAVTNSYFPSATAATYDKDGHLLLLMINNEFSIFGVSAIGVQLAGGNGSTPMLQFLRF